MQPTVPCSWQGEWLEMAIRSESGMLSGWRGSMGVRETVTLNLKPRILLGIEMLLRVFGMLGQNLSPSLRPKGKGKRGRPCFCL
jgi:hypothetical protein